MNKRIFEDIVLLILAYITATFLKNENFIFVFQKYIYLFAIYSTIYLTTSIITNLRRKKNVLKAKILFLNYLSDWSISALAFLSLIYIFEIDFPSRFVILGYIVTFFGLKLATLLLVFSYQRAVVIVNKEDIEHLKEMDRILNTKETVIRKPQTNTDGNDIIHNLVQGKFGQQVLDFILLHIDESSHHTDYLFSNSRFDVLKSPYVFNNIINLANLNDIKKINKYIEAVSIKLDFNGLLICCAITNKTRKKTFLQKFPAGLNYILYFFYFIYKRVWPKLPYFKRIYFYFTGGRDRNISHAEVLGRLYSCGFEYIEHKTIDQNTWYVTKKTSNPIIDYDPTYGPLIRLKRVGKHGKIFNTYKLRTMHPYSEYIQEFVYKSNSFDDGCKFKDDFRISSLGKFCRKYWIDELPMLINLLKGDMKLIGVRPLSNHFFNLYPIDIQQKRIQFKPGLLPPFYADMPNTFEEVLASEKRYLELYEKHKFKTDFKYFFLILTNIIFKKARSK
jgi:lipopolysaccharide/colanic/teichoic acid biosynthesis glycosyltransferase